MFRFWRMARRASCLAAIFLSATAWAVGTGAGVDISNVATATYADPFGTPSSATSNLSLVRINEVLDVTLAASTAGGITTTTPGATDSVLAFTVTNTGNGNETYVLSVVSNLTGDVFDPANVRLYLDNGDNLFDAATDTLHVPGGNDPLLAADASRRLFLVGDIPGGLVNGDNALVRVLAESATARASAGADAPGAVFAGQGSGGSDAVVGSSQADALAAGSYVISLVSADFSKAASLVDPDGGIHPVPGAIVTYTLTFTVSGVGDLTGAVVNDPIPAGTTYVPGSLRLDALALTDATDADAGRFTGTAIRVDLGTVTAPATRTVTFQVTLN